MQPDELGPGCDDPQVSQQLEIQTNYAGKVKRHRPEREIVACTSRQKAIDSIVERIAAFRDSAHHKLGIICKTRACTRHWPGPARPPPPAT